MFWSLTLVQLCVLTASLGMSGVDGQIRCDLPNLMIGKGWSEKHAVKYLCWASEQRGQHLLGPYRIPAGYCAKTTTRRDGCRKLCKKIHHYGLDKVELSDHQNCVWEIMSEKKFETPTSCTKESLASTCTDVEGDSMEDSHGERTRMAQQPLNEMPSDQTFNLNPSTNQPLNVQDRNRRFKRKSGQL